MHLATGIFGSGVGVLLIGPLALLWGLTHTSVYSLPDVDQTLPISHRGFSHTVFCTALVGAGFWVGSSEILRSLEFQQSFALPLTLGIVSGYLQHIFEDMMTKGGGFAVRPFWPIIGSNMSFGWWNYDSRWFTVLTTLALILSISGLLFVFDHFGVVDLSSVSEIAIDELNRYL